MNRCKECGKYIWWPFQSRTYGSDYRIKSGISYWWHNHCWLKMNREWINEYQRQMRERYGMGEYHRDPGFIRKQLDEFMRHH